MAGSLAAKLSPCPGNTHNLALSGSAEPGGGDMVANINWPREFSVSAFISGSWVAAPTSFLFTSAGETYNLRATIPPEWKHMNVLPFPYTVSAGYAPAWANVDGVIEAVIDDSPCCTPEGESTGNAVVVYLGLATGCGSAGTYPYPGCEPKYVEPLSIVTQCACPAAPRVDNWGLQNVPVTIYNWHDLDAVWTLSVSDTQSCDSATGTGSVTAVITKTAGIDYVDIVVTCNVSLSGSVDTASTGHNYNHTVSDTAEIECSDFKFTLTVGFDIACSNGGVNNAISYGIYVHNP